MTDKSGLLKSQGSLYLEFIPKDGLFHKMLLLSLMGFLTGWCNLTGHSTVFFCHGWDHCDNKLLHNFKCMSEYNEKQMDVKVYGKLILSL